MRQSVVALLVVFVGLGGGSSLAAPSLQTISISGTARREAKRPYTDYIVRARQVDTGEIGASVPLDGAGNFVFTGMSAASYLMELVNGQGRVVCTAGPFVATTTLANISINCHRRDVPTAWLLLGAAGAAGITAAVVTAGPASPSR